MARYRFVREAASVLGSKLLLDGERVWDSTLKRLRMGDGVTPGGLVQLAEDDLSAIGIVNANEAQVLNATGPVPNVFPSAYEVTDAASPADLILTLPADAALGSIVYFRVRTTMTKIVTLYDGGTDMEGDDRRILWAGESVLLIKEATGWKRLGGVALPMHGVLVRTAAQDITDADAEGANPAAWTPVAFTECTANRRGLGHGFNVANSQFRAPRKGVYEFSAQAAVAAATAGSPTEMAFTSGLLTDPNVTPQAISVRYAPTPTGRVTHHISTSLMLNLNEYVGVTVRAIGADAQLEHVANVIQTTMRFREVLP